MPMLYGTPYSKKLDKKIGQKLKSAVVLPGRRPFRLGHRPLLFDVLGNRRARGWLKMKRKPLWSVVLDQEHYYTRHQRTPNHERLERRQHRRPVFEVLPSSFTHSPSCCSEPPSAGASPWETRCARL